MKQINIDWGVENNKIKLKSKLLPAGLYFVGLENKESIRFIKMIVSR